VGGHRYPPGSDSLTKRRGIESRVSNGDTSSSGGGSGKRGPEDEFRTPWILQRTTTLEEGKAQSRGT
jgi:hypothetical protein